MTPDRPPRYIVESILGKGATTIQRLEAEVEYYCGLTREWAKVATANAIVELVTAKRAVMFRPDCYMLHPETPVAEKKEPKTIGGYRNYSPDEAESTTPRNGGVKSTVNTGKVDEVGQDDTPVIGAPLLGPEGE